ncbi:carboxypeptidase M32 [uncultured Sphaerochaeta sp.]|uniref:carboxypeptidase M32 n=1 Tax=uncultured Sphaerochaeta sp. TaxID=886478 RepID=UPI002A0A41CD|nr:carboxypeptidase M32 [uncultured Sphaerochaeta sp.]
MTQREAYNRLVELDRQIVLIDHMEATLSWDQEISLSPLGLEERSVQLGYLAQLRHDLASSSEMGDVLAHLEGMHNASDVERGLIRIRRREYEKMKKLPASLVRSISEQGARAHNSWVAARQAGTWSLFSGDLASMVALVREKATLLKQEGGGLYDGLLQEFEEGMRTDQVARLFTEIKAPLISLVDRLASKTVDTGFLYGTYPIEQQQIFANEVLKAMRFDFQRGSCAVSVHPFTTTIGSDDIRITTRYTDPSVMDSFSSTVHEGGHALYEMGASSSILKGTSLASGASLGMHESQSRLWENMIAKSPEFWQYYYPRFKELFPAQTAGVSLDQFVRAINKVERTPIRVNADEVSYSLHVMLRFQLEQMIINGEISIDEVPEAWDAEHRSLLGFTPASIKEGVLQDVHWSSGDFGYFPTYALGNLYGAQIWKKVKEDLPVSSLLQSGDLLAISDYLKTSIYERGAVNTGLETLEKVTNRGLDASLFTSYLEDKFSRLFG